MKWQLWALGLVTLVALAVGQQRWRDRFARERDLSKSERQGSWVLMVADPISGGFQGYDHAGNTRILPAFGAGSPGGFDFAPDRSLLAYLDGGSANGAGSNLQVVNRTGRRLGYVSSSSGTELSCPLLAGGDLLWVEGASVSSTLMEGSLPGRDRSIPGRPVPLPGNLNVAADCPQLSRDGATLAWEGSDGRIHLAPFRGDAVAGPDRSFEGATDFQLSPDGTWMALNSAGGLVRLDAATGTRRSVSPRADPRQVLAISPDGLWIAVQAEGSLGEVKYEAWRVSDGGKVDLDLPTEHLYPGAADRLLRWVALR